VTQPNIAVVGRGLLGRLLAERATKAGECVALYDAAGPTGEGAAARVEAGMITPAAEIPRMTSLFSIRSKWQG